MKKMFTLSALAMMIVAGVFLWGCSKKSSPTAPPTTPQETIEISPNAVVIPDSTMNLLQNIDSTNFDLYYSQGTNIINNLQPGNIFISAKGEGMLRKVRSVVDSLGYTIVHTDSAKLEEVIINGSINIDVTMSPDKVKIIGIKKGVTITTDQKGDYSINFANVAVGWDPANNQPIIIDGNATMTPPNIKTGIKFTNGAVDTLAITVTATQTTNITMKTQGRVFAQGEVQLAEFVMAPITFWIGPVPIVFVPKFKVKLGGKAENEEAISAGVSLVTSETGGFKYKRVGGWLPIINYQQTFGHNVSVAGSAQGSSEITGFVLVPKFGMYFYSLTGPFVDMKFYGKYRYDYPGSYWAIYRGMAFDAGVESDIPGAFNLHYSFNILNFEQQLYNRTLKPRLSSPQNGAANVSVNPTLTWTTCPVATSYRLQVSTDIGFPSFIYNQSVSAASCQINGLSNNTIYYWRVNSSNSNGTSDWSDVWNFTTEAATSATVPTVTTTAASSITQTTATSGGNVTADGGAAVTARGVCWSTTANPTTANSHTSDGTGTGVFTSNITGLTAGTTYHVRAYATNSVGTSYGSDLTFTTATSATVPTVTTTAASSITQTTATSGGNVTSDGGAAVTAKGVCWSTTANPTTANSHTSDGTGTGVFTSSITGLSPGTTYHVRAYATNTVGTSYGSDLTFTTATSATVPTVTTTAASSITQTTATSGGNVTADGGAAVTARGVCWSTTANPTTANSHTSDGTGTGVFTSNITGLTAGTTYHVRAYATNSVGTSYGSDLTFTTTAGGSTTITWISISAGNFTMGSLPGDPYAQDNEQPQHTVYLDAYQISKYEITNSQYKDFMDAGGYSNSAYWTTEGWAWRTNNNITEPLWWSSGLYNSGPSFPNHPVVGVRWYEADAFCRWAGVHLPTEAQWEKAARGTDPTNYWPWGSTWDAGKCNCTYNTAPDTFEYSSPVGFFSAGQSPYGVYDMAGNVWEWCNDWYQSDYYSVSPSSNPAGPATGSYRVIRGGGWYIHDNPCRTVYRDPDGPVYRITHYVGFRPVK